MLFQKRIDRAFAYQAKQKKSSQDGDDELRPADIMEKGDLPAMMIAALVTILPVAVGVLLFMCLAGWLFL